MEGDIPGKRPWKTYLAVAFGLVGVVALAVTLPVVLCQPAGHSAVAGNGSEELAQLEEALAITNASLAEARGQWDGCKKQLGELEGKASELELALARVTELQEENKALKVKVAQQEQQLDYLQRIRDLLQQKIQQLQQQLQDMRTQNSGGIRLLAASLSLPALLLHGMLLL